jgi:chaperonin cofactor prefoldin
MSKAYPLAEFVDPSKFKEYEALKNRFDLVMNSSSNTESQKNFNTSVHDEINRETEDEILNFNKGSVVNDDDDDILSLLNEKDDLPF